MKKTTVSEEYRKLTGKDYAGLYSYADYLLRYLDTDARHGRTEKDFVHESLGKICQGSRRWDTSDYSTFIEFVKSVLQSDIAHFKRDLNRPLKSGVPFKEGRGIKYTPKDYKYYIKSINVKTRRLQQEARADYAAQRLVEIEARLMKDYPAREARRQLRLIKEYLFGPGGFTIKVFDPEGGALSPLFKRKRVV